jgi:uncharacterized protein YpmB
MPGKGNKISTAVAVVIILLVVIIAGALIYHFTEKREHQLSAEEWQQIQSRAGVPTSQGMHNRANTNH